MKILKVLLVILAVIFIAVVAMFLSHDGSYSVERSIVVNACKSDVVDYSTNFRKWEEWTPWANPGQAEYEYSEEQSAEGSWYTWTSDNDSIGSGRIDVSSFDEGMMKFDMHFITPFDNKSTGHVAWEKVEGGYKVSWGSQADLPLMARIFVDGADIADQIGEKFDEGLAEMKALAEALPQPDIQPESQEMESFNYIGKRFQMNIMDLTSELYASTYGMIIGHMMANGIGFSETHKPMSIYYAFDDSTYDADFEIAIPVSGEATAPEGFNAGTYQGGTMLIGRHFGSWDSTGDTWEAMDAYVLCNGIDVVGPPIEMYITDPAEQPDTTLWETQIIYPVSMGGQTGEEMDDTEEDGDEAEGEE